MPTTDGQVFVEMVFVEMTPHDHALTFR